MTIADSSAPSFTPSFTEPKGRSLWRFVAPFAVAVALLSALLTFVVLTGLTRIQPTREVVISFMLINAAIILLLVGIIVREVWTVVQARRRGRAAAKLHVQIVGLFSVIAVLPAVLVAIVANVTIDRGFDRLFSGPTREVIQNSLIVARAYLYEHAELIRGDILGMANDISHSRPLYDQDRGTFRELLTASAASRNLPGAMLIDKDRNILETAQTGIQQSLHDTGAGIPEQRQRKRAGDIGVSRRKLCRCRDPAACIQRHLPLRRPAARSARGRTGQRNPSQRRRIRRVGSRGGSGCRCRSR